MNLTWECEHMTFAGYGVASINFGVDWPPCVACRRKWEDSEWKWDDESPPVFPPGMVRAATSPEGWPGWTIGPTVFGEPDEPPDED